MKITNLVLWVSDNTLSEKFYKKVGFTITHSDDQTATARLDGFDILLVTVRDEAEFARDVFSGEKGRGLYIYVFVDNVDKTYQQLKENGLTPLTEPRDWPWGNREFVLKDPDGYKLCFWHPIRR